MIAGGRGRSPARGAGRAARMTLTRNHEAPLYLLTTTHHERYSLRAQTFAGAVRLARERGHISGGLDLSGLDLSGTDLSGLDLSGSWMGDAQLRGTHLNGTDLTGTDLRGSDLTGARLHRAVLTGAHLTCTELAGADLREAHLDHTNLRATGLAGAHTRGAVLAFTTLGTALNAQQVYAADTSAVQTDLFARLDARPALADRLENALWNGRFSGRARGRRPEDAVLGSDLGAAQHWLQEVDPHTPWNDPRVSVLRSIIGRWREGQRQGGRP